MHHHSGIVRRTLPPHAQVLRPAGLVRRVPRIDSTTIALFILLCCLWGVVLSWAWLSADSASATSLPANNAAVTYQLRVMGAVPSGMTFWVANGPPCANFHVVQLHRGPSGIYRGTVDLQRKASCTVTYLAAYGKVRTPAGFAPGVPTIVIGTVRPSETGFAARHVERWQIPAG